MVTTKKGMSVVDINKITDHKFFQNTKPFPNKTADQSDDDYNSLKGLYTAWIVVQKYKDETGRINIQSFNEKGSNLANLLVKVIKSDSSDSNALIYDFDLDFHKILKNATSPTGEIVYANDRPSFFPDNSQSPYIYISSEGVTFISGPGVSPGIQLKILEPIDTDATTPKITNELQNLPMVAKVGVVIYGLAFCWIIAKRIMRI